MSASTADVLSALKNLVTALNNQTQTEQNIAGALNAANLSVPTLVKPTSGRLAVVSVIQAGTGTGTIYDGYTLTATTKPLYVIPSAVGVYPVNLPVSFGIVVVPGVGQFVTVSYS